MSIFGWFSSKAADKTVAQTPVPDMGHLDATAFHGSAHHGSDRKAERFEHRELLYSVVRDVMIRAEVLAANYRFKVLSLDGRGWQFLIMIDLANQLAGESTKWTEIETQIAQLAKQRHGISVTAVYWRLNEHLGVAAAEQHAQALPASKELGQPTPMPAQEPVASAERSGAAVDPLQSELEAFKKSVASGARAADMPKTRPTQATRRSAGSEDDGFEDTQIVLPERTGASLGKTQYGELT